MNGDKREIEILRPEIRWKGKDITEPLYGPSILIPAPRGVRPWLEDLEEIKEQIGQASGEVLGVTLEVISNSTKLKTGDLILNIRCGKDGLIKSLRVITGREGDTVLTKSVWPEYDSGFEGFCPASSFSKIEDYPEPGLNFIYKGKIPESGKNLSLYERMAEYASDLGVLIECWAMVKNPDLIKKDFLSFDPYLYYWEDKFKYEHGDNFQHGKVWEILSSVKELGSLSEIEEIFFQEDFGFDNRNIDLVTPLLDQMQVDILQALHQNPTLTEVIFSSKASEYWQKRMKVLFERYYGPKGMVFVREVPAGEQKGARKRMPGEKTEGGERQLDEKTLRKLGVIEAIIKGTKFEGLRDAAKAAWERLTGQPYSG